MLVVGPANHQRTPLLTEGKKKAEPHSPAAPWIRLRGSSSASPSAKARPGGWSTSAPARGGVRRSQLTRMAAALSYGRSSGSSRPADQRAGPAAFAKPEQVKSMVGQMLNFTGLSSVVAGPGNDLKTTTAASLQPRNRPSPRMCRDRTRPRKGPNVGPPEPAAGERPAAENVQRLDVFINNSLDKMRAVR